MTKKELIVKTAEKTGKLQKEVLEILDGALGVIADAIAEKDEVRIPDFGVFKPVTKPAQTRTVFGKEYQIEEKETVTFKPYEKFFYYGRR